METLDRAVQRVEAVLEAARAAEVAHAGFLSTVRPEQRPGARNLLHYLALRRDDLRGLQTDLDRVGLTPLTSDLAHVTASLVAVRHALKRLLGEGGPTPPLSPDEPRRFAEGHERLRRLGAEMLGASEDGSTPGVMVTMPTETAYEPMMVRDMIAAGMTCARINCTQDDASAWTAMIKNVRAAEAELGMRCRVFMDLGGAKMRTGRMAQGPRVLRVRPPKDDWGRIVHPVPVRLLSQDESPTDRVSVYDPVSQRYWRFAREVWLEPWIPLSAGFLARVRPGHRIRLTDTRDHRTEMTVVAQPDESLHALAVDRLYLETGLDLELLDAGGNLLETTTIGDYPCEDRVMVLRVGDELVLHADPRPGEPTRFGPDGTVLERAHVSCTLPEALDCLRVGDPVLLDDGIVRAVVKEKAPEGTVLSVVNARPSGTRVQGNKGINVPESDVRLRGLTRKDREDLEFIVRSADGVGLSFVNSRDDVLEFYEQLAQLGAEDIDVVVKIETRAAFTNLPSILLAAMTRPRVCLMIARGDLAVEAGWYDLSHLQEEMLRVAEAAHVPLIWATQVLERLTKTGQPTRAELSDVAMAQRAECVMLNKGPFLVEAIRGLRSLMTSAVRHQAGKTPWLGALEFADPAPYTKAPPAADDADGARGGDRG